jgi:hypothetical protein
MSVFQLRHYTVRFRHSPRARYRLPRELWHRVGELLSDRSLSTRTARPIGADDRSDLRERLQSEHDDAPGEPTS